MNKRNARELRRALLAFATGPRDAMAFEVVEAVVDQIVRTEKEADVIDKAPENKDGIPQEVPSPDFSRVVEACRQYLKETSDIELFDSVDPELVFEEAMMAVYGEYIFEWINRTVDRLAVESYNSALEEARKEMEDDQARASGHQARA